MLQGLDMGVSRVLQVLFPGTLLISFLVLVLYFPHTFPVLFLVLSGYFTVRFIVLLVVFSYFNSSNIIDCLLHGIARATNAFIIYWQNPKFPNKIYVRLHA